MSGAVANPFYQVANFLAAPMDKGKENIGELDFVKNDKLLSGLNKNIRGPEQVVRDDFGAGRASGGSASKFVRGTVGNAYKTDSASAGLVKNAITGKEDIPPPEQPIPEDPAAVADRNKKEKLRAKRQAEIDILTDRPGRAGRSSSTGSETILTDQYTYKV